MTANKARTVFRHGLLASRYVLFSSAIGIWQWFGSYATRGRFFLCFEVKMDSPVSVGGDA